MTNVSKKNYHFNRYDGFFIRTILNGIGQRWPILYEYIKDNDRLTDLNWVLDLIHYPDVPRPGAKIEVIVNHDRVINHIIKNKHMVEFWML